MTYTIYALFDQQEPERVRYVGFSRDPARRFKNHLYEAKYAKSVSHRLNWLRRVLEGGGQVGWRVLAEVSTAEEAAQQEIQCIAKHRSEGHPLTNGTEGGEGIQGFGGVLSEEATARKVATMNTPEYIAKRSEQSGAYWKSQDARGHQREAMRAFWESPEGKAQLVKHAETTRRIQTGTKRSLEAREKMRLAKLGKPGTPRTEEWKEKIAAAQRGKTRRPWTPEERERHKVSDETREKMRASAKARVKKLSTS